LRPPARGQLDFSCREWPQPTPFAAGARSAPQSAKHCAGGRIAKIATFDIKIESMRFALRSAKGAGKASWRHVYESAVTAAGFYIRQTAVRS
jgi:hypothetical protein